MKLKRVSPFIGLAILLVGFGYSAARVLLRSSPASAVAGDDGRTVHLRFGHVTLHDGVVRSFDDAIRDYEELHPHVKIEQILVPLKLWPSWLRTQMVGGTAPDIADMERGQGDEFLARFFLPLDSWTEKANPYNAGTELEGVSWRDTFVDGLANGPAYRASLQQVYGIPLSVGTVRVFANAELMRLVTGGTKPPSDYAEFMELCRLIREFAAKNDMVLVPIAGSQTHALPLLRHLFSSQTQRLAQEINPYKSFHLVARDVAMGYLRGDWNWHSPAVMAGSEIMGEVGRETVAGFAQLEREDSLFFFTQGKAVMLTTGSWEADTVTVQSPFELTIFEVPVPRENDPRFGGNVLGPVSELGTPPGNAMGVTRASAHREVAVDFLRFLTSRPVAERVAARSRRLSSVVGVAPPRGLEVFTPLADGWPGGFSPELHGLASGGSGECARLYRAQLHELVGPRGSAENFARVMDEQFPTALRADVRSAIRDAGQNSRAEDGALAAFELGGREGDELRATRLLEGQTLRELEAAQMQYGLERWKADARGETVR